ncbi:hypothetical protein L1S32_07550 [Methanogenium sp. S4BF]|uniref:TolB family protein n=1 Tax=Methanogenium sp. S4BF TaxID=1789226 RepID=UPI0024161ACB|nr:hypothetical protein [Methanogenium sp. S4BF]WFN33698.1 hypothetical protein L1S32_07550 [Methanogenium sp. S4BF]
MGHRIRGCDTSAIFVKAGALIRNRMKGVAAFCLILSLIFCAGCITEDRGAQMPKDAVNGTQFSGWSQYPSISGDGSMVAFVTGADDPERPFMQYPADIRIRSQETGQLISVKEAAALPEKYAIFTYPSLSGDGRYCAFETASRISQSDYVSGKTGLYGIFVFDAQTGETACVSVASDGTQGNARSEHPVISDDGRYVTFSSWATNLVENDTNAVADVFVHDRQTGETTCITGGDGLSGPSSISGDGRVVVLASTASDLVQGDTNGETDIFTYNRLTGVTVRVSVSSDGTEGNGSSVSPDISTDGRFVSFRSWASNLAEGDTNGVDDVFVHDCLTNETTRVRDATPGTFELGWSRSPPLSGDGRYAAFESAAETLAAGDTNRMEDVFVCDTKTGQTTLISVASDGSPGNGNSNAPDLSRDGRHVVFVSEASSLVEGDENGYADVFVHDRETGRTTMISCYPDNRTPVLPREQTT